MTLAATLPREETLSNSTESLACAYIEKFGAVADLYAGDYRSIDALVERAGTLTETKAFKDVPRTALARSLAAYLRSLDAPDQALEAASRLRDKDCLAVVTGQQPGLAGGPALLLYKAAHAVKLTEQLRHAGINAIAVFWAASEDHDIDEVNRFVAVNSEGAAQTARLKQFASGGLTPLERLTLPKPEDTEADNLRNLICQGPHREEALKLLDLSLGTGFGRALNRVLLKLFGERGLVVMEPRLLRPLKAYQKVMSREIRRTRDNRDAVESGMRACLDGGFELPIEPSPYTNLFLIDRGRRRHVMRVGSGFAVDGRDDAVSRRDLLHELERRPERFSASVKLRPIVQARCLPTLAYVGGPSEIAYHGMLGKLFERYGAPMPTLVPRWSFVLGGVPTDVQAVRTRVREQVTRARAAAAAISEVDNETHIVVANLAKELGVLGKAVDLNLERLRGRVDKTLLELRGRILANPLAGDGVDEELRQSALWICPNLKPQERSLSWLAFWPLWADSLRNAFDSRDGFDFSLRVVEPGRSAAPTGKLGLTN